MASENYQVKLDFFEGPMDLLIHLIKINEVDIYDIPIGTITDQYILYIELLGLVNIDFAGDFLLMAATLIQIKSRMLLPQNANSEDEEDPRNELVKPLLEYLQMKSVAERLSERPILGEDTFKRSFTAQTIPVKRDEEEIHIHLYDLMHAFKKILDNTYQDHSVNLTVNQVSIKDRMMEIISIMEAKGSISFDELFEGDRSRGALIVTFLAILEMGKLNLIQISQNVQSGTIRLFYL